MNEVKCPTCHSVRVVELEAYENAEGELCQGYSCDDCSCTFDVNEETEAVTIVEEGDHE